MIAHDFSARRQQLLTAIGTGNIAIIPAAPEVLRNGDVHYRYRQHSDFYYLTGFLEPNAVAVFIPGREQGEFILFNRPRDPSQEQWTGPRAGQDGACEQFGADEAYPIDEMDERLPQLLQDRQQVFYPVGRWASFDEQMRHWINTVREKVRSGINAPDDFVNVEHILHEMRLIKSESEIARMRHASEISADAHQQAMRVTKPGVTEYQVAAHLEYHCRRQGCHSQAYDSIVGGGVNACVLHYTDNRDVLNDGELVLIDAGGEYDYYAADITRTFPVNGRFSESQRIIYDIVLRAQMAAIEVVRPGNHWQQPQEQIVRIITEGLCDCGLLTGDVDELITASAYRRFYMHNFGHWLGIDVHDVGSYKQSGQWRKFVPGMVLTVEPGIYIPASDDIDARWWNIGIRIEDDVLVTESGNEVLTAGVVKTIDDIEALMAANE